MPHGQEVVRMTETTRRDFVKAAAYTAIGTTATSCSNESPRPQPSTTAVDVAPRLFLPALRPSVRTWSRRLGRLGTA